MRRRARRVLLTEEVRALVLPTTALQTITHLPREFSWESAESHPRSFTGPAYIITASAAAGAVVVAEENMARWRGRCLFCARLFFPIREPRRRTPMAISLAAAAGDSGAF